MTFQCIDPFRFPFVRFSISFALGFCSPFHTDLSLLLYLVIVAARPPSPPPSPSTRLARSVLVLNPPPLALAKQAIIESLSPLCSHVLSPQAPYARYDLFRALSRSFGIAASDLRLSPNSHERTFATVSEDLMRGICDQYSCNSSSGPMAQWGPG